MSSPDSLSENPGEDPAPLESASDPDEDAAPAEARKLSAEEQMALYEESLKETDWGHQPC